MVLPLTTSTFALPFAVAFASFDTCANDSLEIWWSTNGALLGNGCVGEVFCFAFCGTGRSSIGTSGLPVSRSSRYSQPVLLGSPVPCWPSCAKRTTGLGESEFEVSGGPCCKRQLFLPVFASIATMDDANRLAPGRLLPSRSSEALPVEK